MLHKKIVFIAFFIIMFIIIAGCLITDIEPKNSAISDFDSFRIAAFNDNLSEVWFRLSFAVRDKISFKDFVNRWNDIRANLQPIFESEILSIRDTKTGNNLSGKIFKLKSKLAEFEFMLVAEMDNKRFPGESQAIWRIRGFTEAKINTVYGIFSY